MRARTSYNGFYHYLPVNEQSIEWGWYVTGAGRGTIPPGQEYPPQGHPALYQFNWRQGRTLPEFQLILITGGSGVFESNAVGSSQITDGTAILLAPDVWHRYKPDLPTGWTERWISFNGELSHRFFHLRGTDPRPTLFVADDSDFRCQFDHILDRIRDDPAGNSVELSIQTMDLVARALEPHGGGADGSGNSHSHGDRIVSEALQLIWTRSHYSLTSAHIARELSVSRRTLDRHFAAFRGKSVLDEINLCRVERAKRLLKETKLPIKSVAYLSGFPSMERMRVVFLESVGVSPTTFRKGGAQA